MVGCGCGHNDGSGPYSEGRELVEFVARAHGGALRLQQIQGGGLNTACQGCGSPFTLTTFVGQCPVCSGVHAVSPPRSSSSNNIQYAGPGYVLD